MAQTHRLDWKAFVGRIVLLSAAFCVGSLVAESLNHDQMMQLYFLSSDGSRYEQAVGSISGEVPIRPTFGESVVGDSVSVAYRLLEQDSLQAIYAVRAEVGTSGIDIYAYLKHESGIWFVSSLRSLALTGLAQMIVDSTADPSTLSPRDHYSFHRCELETSSDQLLRQYFLDNIASFEQLRQIMLNDNRKGKLQCSLSIPPEKTGATSFGEGDSILCTLGMTSASWTKDSLLECMIGGILDNVVGFLYVPQGNQPPRMEPSDYIYVERITGNWYIFKTT